MGKIATAGICRLKPLRKLVLIYEGGALLA
jgi:hypothetical protein